MAHLGFYLGWTAGQGPCYAGHVGNRLENNRKSSFLMLQTRSDQKWMSKILISLTPVTLWSGWDLAWFFISVSIRVEAWLENWIAFSPEMPEKVIVLACVRCFERRSQGTLIGELAVLLLWWYLFCGQTNDFSLQAVNLEPLITTKLIKTSLKSE